MIQTATVATGMASIVPLLIIWGFACIILIGDTFAWRNKPGFSAVTSLVGIVLALVTLVMLRSGDSGDGGTFFAGSISLDNVATSSGVALLVTGFLSILLAWTYLKNRGLEHGEYYVLLLLSVSGAMLMAMANDLIVLFLGLEILSFALYVMAGFARTDERSEEASIKYFLLGAFASAFLLYGIALVYGATQTTNLLQINAAVTSGQSTNAMLLAGIGLLIVGLGFKAAVIPFHQWTPDVYEGAPTSVTAYMAAAAKIGAFAALLRVFDALAPVQHVWLHAIQLLAILTMVLGNILAVTQTNVKRMLAYSSIAHAGYLLVAVAALAHGNHPVSPGVVGAGVTTVRDLAMSGALFYLFAYTFMTLGAFGVLIYLSGGGRDVQQLSELRGLARHKPGAAYAMFFFMLSLGGIPPTMGFMGKWQIFLAAVSGGEIMLAIAMALSSVIAVYYYLRIVWMMLFEEPVQVATETPRSPAGAYISLVIAAACTVLFGLLPGLLNGITNIAR